MLFCCRRLHYNNFSTNSNRKKNVNWNLNLASILLLLHLHVTVPPIYVIQNVLCVD